MAMVSKVEVKSKAVKMAMVSEVGVKATVGEVLVAMVDEGAARAAQLVAAEGGGSGKAVVAFSHPSGDLGETDA